MPNANDIVDFTVKWLSEQLEQDVGADANFAAMGLDSLDAVRLTDELATLVGVEELPVSLVMENPTAKELADKLVTMVAAGDE